MLIKRTSPGYPLTRPSEFPGGLLFHRRCIHPHSCG
jgi:hypothetical protein